MTYAEYILSTGSELAEWELTFGRYLYESRFRARGHAPVLDIGPGRCWFTKQDPENIVAMDTQRELVTHYQRAGLNIVEGSIYKIPFEPGTFGGVFCCWLFEHLDDPGQAIKEIARVLVTGGYGCVIVPSTRTLLGPFYDDFTHVRPFTSVSLGQLARHAHFSAHRVEPLFWTKGGGRLSRRFSSNQLYGYLRFADRVARSLHLVNRDHLILELWK